MLKGLTEEQIAKLKECKTAEERLEPAKEQDVELNVEQLEAVSGGDHSNPKCPNCGSEDTFFVKELGGDKHYQCRKCSWGFKDSSSFKNRQI